MRLLPKKLGDDLSLDEYNACQYLLYDMDCWVENITLNNYEKYEGKYASYILNQNNILETEKQNNYRIIKELNNNNSTLTIQLSDINSNIDRLNIIPQITLYTKKPQTLKDANNNNVIFDPTELNEIHVWSYDETKETPSLKDYEEIKVKTNYNKTLNQITFQLINQETNEFLQYDSLFNKTIQIKYKFNKKPYIDFRNGKENQEEEILVDNVEELEKLIKNVPTNNKLTVFRLDSNIELPIPPHTQKTEVLGTYYLQEPLIIEKGQNIEIHGGTNNKSRINASLSKRCFIIKPGAKLSLNNIICEYANSKKTYYNRGKGGAILIENEFNEYGILECETCEFINNQSYYGGAIFSYHAGLHLNNTIFTNNSSNYGGAIYYQAKDAVLKLENIITKPGATATLSVSVKDNNKRNINEGEVDFYLRKNGNDVLIGTSRVREGIARISYVVPTETKTVEYAIVAVYKGGRGIDDEIAIATMKIKVAEQHTASWVEGNNYTVKIGETLTVNAKVVNSEGAISTEPTMRFKLQNTTLQATKNGNIYTLKYVMTEKMAEEATDNKLTLKFEPVVTDDYKCNTISTTITVNKEQANNTVKGYVTGLYVNRSTTITTQLIEKWVNAKITDVFIRFTDHTISSLRTNLETTTKLMKNNNYNIRIHASINCLYDVNKGKYYEPTDSSRLNFIKELIDYIASHFDNVAGINLDYVRYSGADGTNSTKENKIANYYKTINEYIKSKNKNYIISTSIKAEDGASASYYGQNHKKVSEYVDYLQPMVYKTDYNQESDEWVLKRVQYILDQGVSPDKITVALQSYKSQSTLRTKSELTTTAKQLSTLKIKGIVLFREGLTSSEYVQDYNSIMGGN